MGTKLVLIRRGHSKGQHHGVVSVEHRPFTWAMLRYNDASHLADIEDGSYRHLRRSADSRAKLWQ